MWDSQGRGGSLPRAALGEEREGRPTHAHGQARASNLKAGGVGV